VSNDPKAPGEGDENLTRHQKVKVAEFYDDDLRRWLENEVAAGRAELTPYGTLKVWRSK
jgi:hypothetical protein